MENCQMCMCQLHFIMSTPEISVVSTGFYPVILQIFFFNIKLRCDTEKTV